MRKRLEKQAVFRVGVCDRGVGFMILDLGRLGGEGCGVWLEVDVGLGLVWFGLWSVNFRV